MELFNATISTLERALDTRMAGQKVIASNLANVDTPGYTAQKLDFEATMERALDGGVFPVVEPSAAPAGADGNNVDVEQELSALSRNKLMYSVTSQIMGNKLRQISTVFEQNA